MPSRAKSPGNLVVVYGLAVVAAGPAERDRAAVAVRLPLNL